MAQEAKAPITSGNEVQVKIPTPLARFTDGQVTVKCRGGSIKEVIEDLESQFPGIGALFFQEDGRMNKFLRLVLNGVEVLADSSTEVAINSGDNIEVIVAIAGG